MQRPYNNLFRQMAAYIKDLNIPLWVDYDDNLLDIPTDNSSFLTYSNTTTKQNIAAFLRMADVVTVSTEALKKAFGLYNTNIIVVPNAFNTDVFNYRNIEKRNNTTLWRGSETHQLDIMVYMDQLTKKFGSFKNWKWHYCGYYPWMLKQPMPETSQMVHTPNTDVIIYHKTIHNISPKCMMVPLADHNFNRCKSNIAAIEGTFAGAVCVVPDWEEWQIPGTLKYSTPQQFGDHIENIYRGKVNIKKNNQLAWQYINDVYSLTTVNKQRIQIIKSFM